MGKLASATFLFLLSLALQVSGLVNWDLALVLLAVACAFGAYALYDSWRRHRAPTVAQQGPTTATPWLKTSGRSQAKASHISVPRGVGAESHDESSIDIDGLLVRDQPSPTPGPSRVDEELSTSDADFRGDDPDDDWVKGP